MTIADPTGTPPFTLPTTPIDRYDVTYYAVELQLGRAIVREVRAVYIALATYLDVFPGGGHGAPFEAEWIFYENGKAMGRSAPGWTAITARTSWAGSFATRAEANAYAVVHLRACLAGYRRNVADVEREIESLTGADGTVSLVYGQDPVTGEHRYVLETEKP